MAELMRDSNDNAEQVYFHDEQLSCMGLGWIEVPKHIITSYSAVVRRLDINFNDISSVDDLHLFPKLEELILDNNHINDETAFPSLPHLHTLSLNKNKLKDLDMLLDRLETACPSLTYLSLHGNEACPDQLSSCDKDEEDYQRYRYYVLYRLPKLKFLDAASVRDVERKEAKRQGPFLKVVRPPTIDIAESTDVDQDRGQYTPLPGQLREDPSHQATFGKCKYVYYGRHSEGNRFIRNNDL